MNDLWPDDIGISSLRAPLTILKEQAANLGQKTKNIVEARVMQLESNSYLKDYDFVYGFFLTSAALNNYQYLLFTAKMTVDFYPLRIEYETSIGEELGGDYTGIGFFVEVRDEEQFFAVLKEIFSATKTRRVVQALLAQSGHTTSVANPVTSKPVDDIPF
jgi:hypothetical protein